jgi:hypothetical protein
LTEKNDLFDLDKYLENKIKNEIKIFQLQQRLRKYSFMDGFNNKHFSPFKTEELKEILKSWD